MPCLLVVLALSVPRLVVALLYVFSSWFAGVVQPPVLAILGFLFLPTSLLWYSAVHHWYAGVWGPWQIAGGVVAVLLDLGPLRGKK